MMGTAECFGDVHCPAIQSLVQQLDNDCRHRHGNDEAATRVAFVQAAFAWVRDEVDYEWQVDWTVTVQETLARRRGNCFVKACLLVTLLRARGIVADYAVARISLPSPLVWRMAPDWAWSLLPTGSSPHVAVMVQLVPDEWIILDPSTDAALAQGMRAMGNTQAITAPWNGGQHVAMESFIQSSPRRHQDICDLLRKKPYYRPAVAALFNASADYLRQYPRNSSSPTSMHRALDQHLLSYASHSILASALVLPPGFDGRDNLVAAVKSGQTSVFCNPHHRAVQKMAQRLRLQAQRQQRVDQDRAFAQAAFRFVRDHVDYTLQNDWSVPVQQTLALRRGMCSTTACLLTALLRAGGLRAGFFLKPQNAMQNFVVPSFIADNYSAQSIHVISAVQFKDDPPDSWIKLDPYIDGNLARSMDAAQLVYEEGYKFLVDFDGHHDALGYGDPGNMELRTDHVDDLMMKQSRIHPAVLQCHNICLELLRNFGPLFSSQAQVVDAMEKHLLNFYPNLVTQVIKAGGSKRATKRGHAKTVLSLAKEAPSTDMQWPTVMPRPLTTLRAKV